MRNLENYGVQELNLREARETEGGFLVAALVIIALLWSTNAY